MTDRLTYLNQQLTWVDGQAPKDKLAKHIKMATHPFVFFRGASQLFYDDLKSGVLTMPEAFSSVPNTCIMGDCHLSNFGFLTEEGSHGDNVIFAPNDFDDACVAPAIWDVSRFAVSLLLAADHGEKVVAGQLASEPKYVGKVSASSEQAELGMMAFFQAYRETCQHSIESAAVTSQALQHFDDSHLLAKPYNKALKRSATGCDFLTKSRLAKAVDWQADRIRFKQDPEKFEVVSSDLYRDIEQTFAPYVDDTILDITARLGSGTGSLNLSRFYLLVGPRDFQGESDLPLCHIVEVKQQRKAAPLYHFDNLSPINRLNPAHLTIQCQRRMQRNPDLVLDEVVWRDAYWLIRSRHHAKVGIDPEMVMVGKKAVRKGGLEQYAQACGKALALAHCRGDRRSSRFEQAMLSAFSGEEQALLEICKAYAKQVAVDTELLNQLIAG